MNSECCRCRSPLSDKQQRDGNRYCSRSCAYLAHVGSADTRSPTERDYKRKRFEGGLRPIDVPRDAEGFPLEVHDYDSADLWFSGPLRLQTITRREYPDGRTALQCPACWQETSRLSDTEGWCAGCALSVLIYPPLPRPPRQRREPVQTQAKGCPVCGALHTRRIYCSLRCCQVANERRKTERKRKPQRSACPQGHQYDEDSRRIRTRVRDGVAHVETECLICYREREKTRIRTRR